MIELYSGSGSSEVELLYLSSLDKEFQLIKKDAAKVLRSRGGTLAAELLLSIDYSLYKGTNFFNDEFNVLVIYAHVDKYTEYYEMSSDQENLIAFKKIAKTITELGIFIRFIVVELESSNDEICVNTPVVENTTETVERAFRDCELLVSMHGAPSGVDRIHTAFHGYLRLICSKESICVPSNASTTQLFKAIQKNHPAFLKDSPRKNDTEKIARSIAVIIDALNPVRNDGSLAHPNEDLLQDSEATLVINCVNTLLHYINGKINKEG